MLSTNLAGAYYCFLFLFFIEYFSTPPGLQHTDPLVGLLLDLLGIVLGPITALVGVNCSPISVIGAGGNSCSATPVCCAENGIVRLFPLIIGEHRLIYTFTYLGRTPLYWLSPRQLGPLNGPRMKTILIAVFSVHGLVE